MNGIHDMGGMHGFEFPERRADEPVFKSVWEKRVFSSALGFAGPWTLDRFRSVVERLPPRDYLGPYYSRWLSAMEKLLVEHGIVSEKELRSPDGPVSVDPDARPADGETLVGMLKVGRSARRDGGKAGRFRAGETVRVKNEHPTWHTRMPRYVRGRQGLIGRDHGSFVFPDTNSRGLGEQPQHCYNVLFSASELWGDVPNPADRVHVDLWDDYLEPVA